MNLRVLFTGLFLLSITTIAHAQNDWRAGYIILNSGDTTSGLVDYRSPITNNRFCYFKTNNEAKSQKLAPGEIAGYRYINGKYFVSKEVTIDNAKSTIFLEFLVDGQVNLYFMKKESDVDIYFIEKEGEIFELKNSMGGVKVVKGNNYYQEEKEYLGVLSYVLNDAKMQSDINLSEFNHKSLIKITKKYHQKMNKDQDCITFEKKQSHTKVNFGLVFGLNSQSLYLREHFSGYEVKNESTHLGGLSLNIKNIPGIYERFSLQIEVLAYQHLLNVDRKSNLDLSVEKKYALNVPIMADYRLLATKVYPKIEAGASIYMHPSKDYLTSVNAILGLSFHYDYRENKSVFLFSRIESRTNIVRFGGGIYF